MFDLLRRLLSAPPPSDGLRVEATGGGVAAARDIINSPIITGLGEEDVERRHREQLAGQEEILRAIAKEKGVEEAPLREVLKKLGEADTPYGGRRRARAPDPRRGRPRRGQALSRGSSTRRGGGVNVEAPLSPGRGILSA